MSGEQDLGQLLARMEPILEREPWVFVTVEAMPEGIAPLMSFREEEGLTLVVRPAEARALGLPDTPVFCRITLGVLSSLEAVGLTAAVAGALTAVGISANVVAAYHHDHVFVPAARADDAMARLSRLRAG